jgi:lactoylglutathione lyase
MATSNALTYVDVPGTIDASTSVNIPETAMARVQLALNVSDLDQAVEFYSKLFATAPAKRRPGYANFAITEPALKLVLIEGQGDPGTLNHLGVEVESTEQVGAAQRRLSDDGLPTATEENVSCCFAVQDKVWVDAPDGEPWEIYTVLADAETIGDTTHTMGSGEDAMCCASAPESAARCC